MSGKPKNKPAVMQKQTGRKLPRRENTKKRKKVLTNRRLSFIILLLSRRQRFIATDRQCMYGGITQLVEYPVHTRYVICSNQIAATIRPVGQAAKTPPFHGGNVGSIPARVTKKEQTPNRVSVLFCCPCGRTGSIRFEHEGKRGGRIAALLRVYAQKPARRAG